MQNGKGDTYRKVNWQKWSENYDHIFGKNNMKFQELETYQDLLNYLTKLSKNKQLKKLLSQPIQTVEPSPFELKTLLPVLAIGSVKEMGFAGCRSATDNKYHEDDLVLLTDHNPFGEKGEIGYLVRGPKHERKSIYGKQGKTNKKDQMAPKISPEKAEVSVLKKRMKD